MKIKLMYSLLISSLLLTISVNRVSAQTTNQISCKVHPFLVSNSTTLPFKYDSSEIINGSTVKTGDSIVYVFDITNNSNKDSVILKKVSATQIEKSNEPIEIIQTRPLNGECTVNSNDKSIICETNYSFAESAHYPIEYLFKITDNLNNYPKTSTLFDIETDAGNTQCASMLMIKKSNEVVVQTSVPSNAPVENNELEQINSKIENLNNKLNNQQTLLNKLQQTVDDISNFLKGIFNSIFAN